MLINKPKAIIFDWDGTLADSRPAVVKAMEYVLSAFNKEPWDIIKTKYRDTTKSLKDNFPNFFGGQADNAYQMYLSYYQKHCLAMVKPADMALQFLELCQTLKIDLYIVSNKDKVLLLPEVKQCFSDIHFCKIIADKDTTRTKPFADPVLLALSEVAYPINAENVWMIGDSRQDIECAFNAGVKPVLLDRAKFMDDEYIKTKQTTDCPIEVYDSFAMLSSVCKLKSKGKIRCSSG